MTPTRHLRQFADQLGLSRAGGRSGNRAVGLHVIKNQLPFAGRDAARTLGYERVFQIPGDPAYRLRKWLEGGFRGPVRELAKSVVDWLQGKDPARFRDWCDEYFRDEMVPEIRHALGDLADPLINTINEAIINYAEYSFGKRSLGRRIEAHVFQVGTDLAYAIIHAGGGRPRTFDPTALQTKKMGSLRDAKRGWGHTIMLERALFVGFDQTPERRGMLIVVGPAEVSR